MNAMPHGKRNARNRTVFEHLLLMAVQYTSDKIKTLWSHGYLTKEENPNITSGKVYRIRNPLDGNNFQALSTGSAGTLAEYNRTSDDFKYKFTYLGDGLYKITRLGDDTKALTASGTVKYTDYTGKDSQKWYVEGSDSSFYLVPLSRPTFFLTSGGKSTPKLGYNAYGGNWRLYGAEVTIYNYYDTGMLTRWNMSEAQMKTAIDDYVNEAIEFYKDYGVDIKKGPTVHIESIADKCTGASTNAQLNAKCEHYASTGVNHKDNQNLYKTNFTENCSAFSASDPFIPIFWTGHFTWDPTDSPDDVTSDNRVTNGGFSWGVFKKATGIMMLNNGAYGSTPQESFSSVQRVRFTVFHELGHALCGLPNTYCAGDEKSDKKCSNPNCAYHYPETGYKIECLMTNDFMQSKDKSEYFCDVCKKEAAQNIPKRF